MLCVQFTPFCTTDHFSLSLFLSLPFSREEQARVWLDKRVKPVNVRQVASCSTFLPSAQHLTCLLRCLRACATHLKATQNHCLTQIESLFTHTHTRLEMARSYLPPGFRFHPTDEELVVHYLKKKVTGRRLNEGVIGEIEIYNYEPTDLPGLAILRSRDPEWFFFNAQSNRHLLGARTNRTTRAGYWKATGKDRKITAGSCKGLKKTLIYHMGRAPHGVRTDWVMHEYRLDEEYEKKMNCPKSFVLCRIRRKGGLGPRNGEQYGAPVLDEHDEEEGISTSYPLEEEGGLPPREAEIVEGLVLQTPHVPTDEGVRDDYIDCFLQTLISLEEQEKQPVEDEVLSLDDLLVLVENLEDFAVVDAAQPAHTGPSNFVDLGFGDGVNYGELLHPADAESVILQDMLRQAEISDGFNGRKALQGLHSQAPDDVQNGGFIEFADLEEPYDDQGTLESHDIEELICELNNRAEIPMSTSLAHERSHVQNLQSFGDEQSSRGSRGLHYSAMVNEQLALEVLLDSSRGLNMPGKIYTNLLTSDDGGGSGCVLRPHQEREFADNSISALHQGEGGNLMSSSHQEEGCSDISISSTAHGHFYSTSRTDEPSEAQLVDSCPTAVELHTQDGIHSVASTSQEETMVAHGEHVTVDSTTSVVQAVGQPNSTTVLLNNDTQLTSSVSPVAPSHSSPSSFARAISGFLGKADALPASAEELPVELEKCKSLLKESSNYFVAKGKIAQTTYYTHPSSLSNSSASVHFRVKSVDLERTSRTPEIELQCGVAHSGSSLKPHKSFTNDLSTFLFRMATLAVILFCMCHSFCRSIQSAFV